jgi:hypothetical protein
MAPPLNFTKIEMSNRDGASGMATGKRQHKPFVVIYDVSSSDNSVSQVKSPRDAASGLTTGRRQHQPVAVSKEMDKSSPKLAESVLGSGGGSGKVNVQDISFVIRCGGKSTKLSVVDGECVIPTDTCPNGSCSLICSWSWGASNSGTSSMGSGASGRCSVDFLLEIEDFEVGESEYQPEFLKAILSSLDWEAVQIEAQAVFGRISVPGITDQFNPLLLLI